MRKGWSLQDYSVVRFQEFHVYISFIVDLYNTIMKGERGCVFNLSVHIYFAYIDMSDTGVALIQGGPIHLTARLPAYLIQWAGGGVSFIHRGSSDDCFNRARHLHASYCAQRLCTPRL